MTDAGPLAAVTGASGYLGFLIRKALESTGWQVVACVRSPLSGDPLARRYDLSQPVDAEMLRSTEVLVHCAYDFTITRRAEIWRINVQGTERLLAAAKEAGVKRIIVLSTMSAYEGTAQLYGQAKLAIEAATRAAGGCAIRPGLVYGNDPGGMAGALRKMIKLPLVPVVGGRARQFVVHEEDLAAAIATLAVTQTLPEGPIGVAHPKPVTFRTLLEEFAAAEGRRRRFVEVPWRLLYGTLRLSELLRVRLPFRADSLLGLVHSAPSLPGTDQLVSLGIRPRPFPAN